jgi:hypothetical protein
MLQKLKIKQTKQSFFNKVQIELCENEFSLVVVKLNVDKQVTNARYKANKTI